MQMKSTSAWVCFCGHENTSGGVCSAPKCFLDRRRLRTITQQAAQNQTRTISLYAELFGGGHKVQNKISAEFKSHHGGHKVHNKIRAEFKSQGFVAWEDEDGITWLAPCRHRNA